MPSKKSPKLAHVKMQGAVTPADYRNKLSASIVENAENVASLNMQYAAIAQIAQQSDLIPASYPEGSSRMASEDWNAELDNSASLKAYGIPPLRLPPVRSKALANDSGFPNSGMHHCLDTYTRHCSGWTLYLCVQSPHCFTCTILKGVYVVIHYLKNWYSLSCRQNSVSLSLCFTSYFFRLVCIVPLSPQMCSNEMSIVGCTENASGSF